MKYILGVAGGIGSGKTIATNLFNEEFGATIVDVDVISRYVLGSGKPAVKEVAARFGQEILDENGDLIRSKLRDILFRDQALLDECQNITRPYFNEELDRVLLNSKSQVTILVSGTLFEHKLDTKCDATIAIDTPESLQVERASIRDKTSNEDINRIMSCQMSREERIQNADFVIVNDGDLAAFEDEIRNFVKNTEFFKNQN